LSAHATERGTSDPRTALTTPLNAPAYPLPPYRFTDREYFRIAYRSDLDAVRKVVPEPLTVKGAWTAPGRLQLFEHALAPLADLPVREVISATHILTDLTLGGVQAVHDYLAE
jgi:acetoacetate decarboxylase